MGFIFGLRKQVFGEKRFKSITYKHYLKPILIYYFLTLHGAEEKKG
jgi:hypothetical protein